MVEVDDGLARLRFDLCAIGLKTTFAKAFVKPRGFAFGTFVAIWFAEIFYCLSSLREKMMIKFKLGLAVFGLILGLTMLAAPSSANAQCYANGYNTYYAPTYQYSNYVPSYGYSTYYTPTYGYNNYYAPTYGYNQGYYGNTGYYDVRRERLRRALTLAVVAGAVIAISNDDNRGRNRNRNRRGW